MAVNLSQTIQAEFFAEKFSLNLLVNKAYHMVMLTVSKQIFVLSPPIVQPVCYSVQEARNTGTQIAVLAKPNVDMSSSAVSIII